MARTRGKRRWLDYDEVAEFAGCAAVSVRNACQRGRLPYRIITWRAGNYLRRKRVIADIDAVNWLYAKAPSELLAYLGPHPAGSRHASSAGRPQHEQP